MVGTIRFKRSNKYWNIVAFKGAKSLKTYPVRTSGSFHHPIVMGNKHLAGKLIWK
jgi:hypothetical protein